MKQKFRRPRFEPGYDLSRTICHSFFCFGSFFRAFSGGKRKVPLWSDVQAVKVAGVITAQGHSKNIAISPSGGGSRSYSRM